MRVFNFWAALRGEVRPIYLLSPIDLDKVLQSFFGEIRKTNGDESEPNSLASMQAGVDRYLKENNYNYSCFNYKRQSVFNIQSWYSGLEVSFEKSKETKNKYNNFFFFIIIIVFFFVLFFVLIMTSFYMFLFYYFFFFFLKTDIVAQQCQKPISIKISNKTVDVNH